MSKLFIVALLLLLYHCDSGDGEKFSQDPRFIRKHWLCFVLGICATTPSMPVQAASPNYLKTIYKWNQLEYEYLRPEDKINDNNKIFTQGLTAPIDVDVFYSADNINNKVFVTIPRLSEEVPASLGTVSNKSPNGNPLISPYPNWYWHQNPEQCRKNRIVSVFRIKIDECNRLWVLDTGKIGEKYLCSPQIMAFDLNTNNLLVTHEFPQEVTTLQHLLVTPMVDVRDPNSGCKDTFIYIADVMGFALLVYDVARDKSWRIQDKTFYPYPTYGTYNVAGESFDLMDGILGLALSPHLPGQDRVLFYHAMSSPTENWVYTSFLRNSTIFQYDPAAAPQIFNTYRNQRNTQSAAEAMDKDGIMFFGLISDIKIACWNIQTDYETKNFQIVADDPVTLQFPSGLKIVRNRKGEQELWILTNRFQKLANGSLNPREPNFHILAGKVEDLIYGTKCKTKHSYQNQVGGGAYGFYENRG